MKESQSSTASLSRLSTLAIFVKINEVTFVKLGVTSLRFSLPAAVNFSDICEQSFPLSNQVQPPFAFLFLRRNLYYRLLTGLTTVKVS